MAGKVSKGKPSKRRPAPYSTKRSKLPNSKRVDKAAVINFEIEYLDVPEEDIARGNLTYAQRKLVDNSEYIKSPFNPKGANPGELDQRICVTPREAWYGMRKYANFVIAEETYSSEEIVFVRGDHTPPQDEDLASDKKTFWVAKILEVRASSPQHVYALAAWFYWPGELPPAAPKAPDQISPHRGQRIYHGEYELVASNHLEILDVMSFAGKADVIAWDEETDGSEFMAKNLYWRQTFCRGTKALSEIREHCICRGHYNPNLSMFICDTPTCGIWLHKVCLTEFHLQEAFRKLKPEREADARTAEKNLKAKRPMYSGMLAGAFDPVEGAELTITIHDLRKGSKKTFSECIRCPMCKQKITP